MEPIKKFDFSGLDDKLAKKYIKIHNGVCQELTKLRAIVQETSSQQYLDAFLNKFQPILVDSKFLESTIVCCSSNDLESVFLDLEKITTSSFKQEMLAGNSLSSLEYYVKIEKKKSDLESKNNRSNKEDKKLLKYTEILSDPIELFPLLLKIFDYSGKRIELLKFYTNSLHQVCAYCLAQSTSIYQSNAPGKKFYLTGNLDHIKAKATYPLFSLSLRNLVPVCGHCNQRKSDTEYKYDPFNPKHKHKFVFTDCLEYDDSTSSVKLKSLEKMQISPNGTDFSKLAEKLDYEKLYQNFSGNAEILVDRFQKFHSKGYKTHVETVSMKRNINSEMKYFVSDIPLINENIHKYPLTKFKIDLFKEIKAKYDQNK